MVATDYAGLGVHKYESEQPIVHGSLASPSHANDAVCAVQVAQKAFSGFPHDFVVIGHSQRGGAIRATSERQVNKPISGYLGGVAISPVTTILN